MVELNFIILTSVITGIVLGLLWRGKIVSLILLATLIGLITGILVGDWGGFFRGMFSGLWEFIYLCRELFGYFGTFLIPGLASALVVYTLKKYCSKLSG